MFFVVMLPGYNVESPAKVNEIFVVFLVSRNSRICNTPPWHEP